MENAPVSQTVIPRPNLPGPIALLKQAWSVFGKNFWLFLTIISAPTILAAVVAVMRAKALPQPLTTTPGGLILEIVNFLVSILAGGAIITAGLKLAAGETTSADQAYRRVFNLFFPFLWLNILMLLIIWGGTTLLIIPGIILSLCFFFTGFIFFSGTAKGIDALLLSKDYAKGYTATIFGRLLVVGLILMIPLLLVTIPFGGTNTVVGTLIITIVSGVMLQPLIVLYSLEIFKKIQQIKGVLQPQSSKKAKRTMYALAVLGLLSGIGLTILFLKLLAAVPVQMH